jgi:protocatechuate 3,4-dioxygenase beta subunit
VIGRIVDESTNQPLEAVSLALAHADHHGLYFPEQTKWNPRLFAYLITNQNGQFVINTIMPGRYQDEEGNSVAAHIHFTLNKKGYRVYGGEFTFEDDSILMAQGNIENLPVAKLQNSDSIAQYHVTIPMQLE